MAGDLKLAYAQFEELETFSRFGARVDESTRKLLEHGKRIRSCLKQKEFTPVSVPAQICVLLGLTEGLFDAVPIEKMGEAEQAVQAATETIPEDVRGRFETADTLSGEDKKAMLAMAREALAPFQPKPEAAPEDKAKSDAEPTSKAPAKDDS